MSWRGGWMVLTTSFLRHNLVITTYCSDRRHAKRLADAVTMELVEWTTLKRSLSKTRHSTLHVLHPAQLPDVDADVMKAS